MNSRGFPRKCPVAEFERIHGTCGCAQSVLAGLAYDIEAGHRVGELTRRVTEFLKAGVAVLHAAECNLEVPPFVQRQNKTSTELAGSPPFDDAS